jgi:glycosyltransferase involved in cell wall biosynthesis
MPSCGKSGKKESGLSLFQIDAGREWRGGQRQSFLLAKELKNRGYPLYFYVQPNSPLFRRAKEEGIPVVPLKVRSEMDFFAVARLALAMKRKNCRLIHCHDAHSAAIGAAAASLAKVPLRIMSRRVDFPLKNNALSRMKYLKDVSCIVAISEGVREVLLKGGIPLEKIEVIPSGIDFSAYEYPASRDYLRKELSFEKDDYLVGIIAHLADHKGHRYLIEATKILKEKAPKIKVIIVGEGPLRLDLDQQVNRSGVEDMVFFLGFREDVPQILASLDLFVLSSYLEGLGTVLMDAMASSLPVVATRVGGIPEVVKDGLTGILVPPRNVEALAEAILHLYSSRDLAARMGKEGHDVVHRNFSAQAMAGKVADLYERLAKGKGIRLHG